MKYFLVALIMMNVAMAAPTANKKTLPINKDVELVKAEAAAKAHALSKAKPSAAAKTGNKGAAILEDCDDKAEKAKEIVIEPETISLGSGDTGCSLDEINK